MAREINVEDVFPVALFRRTGLDFTHVDVEFIECLQGVNQRAGSVMDGKEDGSAIVSGSWAGFLTDDKESSGIR